jgi:D-glycero-D-manno-heptose 1,7-bisphosphate phosphatase
MGRAAAVFLDRDGVLVETFVRGNRAFAPTTLADFHVVPDAAADVRRLRDAGLVPIVVTNQPDVARGHIAPDVLSAMHERLADEVPVQDILVCTHDSDAGCACRKPRPGMLQAAAARWGLDLPRSFMVGDRWSDVDAGRAAGCCTILIERPYSGAATADVHVASLTGAVDAILGRWEGTGR